MKQRFAAIMLIFMAFVGLGIMNASAQIQNNQAASSPAVGQATATGTYSQDYQQGMLQGLRMGFTMQALLCAAQYNQSAAQEYNTRVDSFNQMISQVFGSGATQEMYLQPLNMTQLEQVYASERAAVPAQP
ncbi:MAG TPA: hypothetical protein VN455_13560 [Methanotrichaceae archaeon]|nr:hypothetical protein [Methanotrichaceae archaeon]